MDKTAISPILKWVGGKRQLLKEILDRVPRHDMYIEPFLGGGAVAFALQSPRAMLSDRNSELILTYRMVKEQPRALIEHLRTHENTPEHYYAQRGLDRDPEQFYRLGELARASRFIFLNKTGFNGLYRVNSRGECNVPFGRYKNPKICDEHRIVALSKYLRDVHLSSADYTCTIPLAREGAFFYFDPPYHPISDTANFTGYVAGGFSPDDQRELSDMCRQIDAMGGKFLLSNSDAPLIRELYDGFTVDTVQAKRAVNSDATKRGSVNELLIRNY